MDILIQNHLDKVNLLYREDLVTQPEITEDISMVIDTSLDQFLEIQPPEGNLKVDYSFFIF